MRRPFFAAEQQDRRWPLEEAEVIRRFLGPIAERWSNTVVKREISVDRSLEEMADMMVAIVRRRYKPATAEALAELLQKLSGKVDQRIPPDVSIQQKAPHDER